jgi:hypothetical protein
MISIIESVFESDLSHGTVLLQKGEQTDMKAYKDGSPKSDKLDAAITSNKFSGKDEGVIDPSAAPPNPEVAYQYVNTPLSRITKTRI